jgi:hypothetical protein
VRTSHSHVIFSQGWLSVSSRTECTLTSEKAILVDKSCSIAPKTSMISAYETWGSNSCLLLGSPQNHVSISQNSDSFALYNQQLPKEGTPWDVQNPFGPWTYLKLAQFVKLTTPLQSRNARNSIHHHINLTIHNDQPNQIVTQEAVSNNTPKGPTKSCKQNNSDPWTMRRRTLWVRRR